MVQLLFFGNRDKTMKLWDPKDSKIINALDGHTDSVFSI